MKQNTGGGENGGGGRKSSKTVTIAHMPKKSYESMFAAKHQRRETCLKNLRECAIRLTNGDNIAQMDTLLRDQVININLSMINYP